MFGDAGEKDVPPLVAGRHLLLDNKRRAGIRISPRPALVIAFKKPKGGELTEEQKAYNKEHNGKRAVGERMFALLKTTFEALRRVTLCPRGIGKIVAGALVLLHAARPQRLG